MLISLTEINDPDFASFIKPSQALDVFTEHIPPRFAGMDENWKNKFIEAMKWEDSKLRNSADKYQLERWYQSTLDLARDIVNKAYDMQSSSKAKGGADSRTKLSSDESADGLL